MNFNLKISVILLHLFTTTLPISHNAGTSLNVFASTLNDSSPIQKISTIAKATTRHSESCTPPYCYNLINNDTRLDETLKNDRIELIKSAKEAGENKTMDWLANMAIPVHIQNNRLITSSMIYGLLTLAAQKPEKTQCNSELGQIYDGINRKEIWAMKGKYHSRMRNFVVSLATCTSRIDDQMYN